MTFEPFLDEVAIAKLQLAEAQSDKVQKRTPEQIEAIYTHGNNVLVSASAGSGKTFVMVERILDKIKRGVGINELFISTFTVKAAGELKERLEKKLMAELATTIDEELKQHLSIQLAGVQQADIGTMDAFTQKLVNQYSYVLGIAPHFRILTDKSEQDILKNEVFSQVFTDYYEGEDNLVFQRLVKNFVGKNKSTRAFYQVVDKIYNFTQSTDDPEQWLTTTFAKGYENFRSEADLPSYVKENLISKMRQAAQGLEDVTLLDDYSRTKKDGQPTAAYQKHEKIFTQLYEWAATPSIFPTLSDLAQAVRQILPSSPDVTVKGVKYPIFKGLQVELTDLEHLHTILHYQDQAMPLLRCLQSFVEAYAGAYLARKIEEGAFEFSDISHFAIKILRQYPEIRQAYQTRYHEVMVDEYQDNNHTQETMLDLLSNGHNRFMVGDIKQSIYRFRQADPQIFNQKFKLFQANPEAGRLILLKENFRSQSEVLDATNSLFSHLMDEEIGDINYDATHALVAGSERQKQAQVKHRAEFLIYDTDEVEVQTSESEEGELSDLSLNEVNLVIKEIIRLHNEEGVSFDEITLLVPSRTRNEGILAAFHEHGIPLVADGGEQHYLKSLEVQIMLDSLRAINQPLNDYALVALLRSPMFNFDEDELTRLALQLEAGTKHPNLYEKMRVALAGEGQHPELILPDFREKLVAFEKVFQKWRQFAKLHSLHDLIWQIYNDRFYYDYVGALPNGVQRQANLYALALRADNFEKTGFKGLARFIYMINQILESENDLADVPVSLPKNAVQLMTIHKSKGLEFKYVFILNMDKSFFSNKREVNPPLIISREHGVGIKLIADIKADLTTPTYLPQVNVSMETLPYQLNRREERLATLSESMRLLYVAMTRAETKLYLVGKGSQEKLSTKFDGQTVNGYLPTALRSQMDSFQDWFLAVTEAFEQKMDLHFDIRYINASQLGPEQIGRLAQVPSITPDQLQHNRQSEDLVQALEQLEAVESLNQTYQAAINLPTVRTPSQIKKLYQPIMEEDRLTVMDQAIPSTGLPKFELPNFEEEIKVTSAMIGSAYHELMQRLPLHQPLSLTLLEEIREQVQVPDAVKAYLNTEKVLAFFETELGRFLQTHHDLVRREVPFAMLMKDPVSQEDFVVRGIVDGFVQLPDRIILFDYKTDQYKHSQDIVMRYKEQMQLYAQALARTYVCPHVDQYLILLGGKQIEVVQIN